MLFSNFQITGIAAIIRITDVVCSCECSGTGIVAVPAWFSVWWIVSITSTSLSDWDASSLSTERTNCNASRTIKRMRFRFEEFWHILWVDADRKMNCVSNGADTNPNCSNFLSTSWTSETMVWRKRRIYVLNFLKLVS